ncbi:pentatricopeptide repeat-containing protein At1g77360, mitochondrial-like [Diospyros lotus]|uniref:pentatricopeptide repeat-containing protein At1g77360, mitochondrial-like n=1 Tax=Diospyros lotus TaxID=55363 RepID=UPI0022562733|nr:pentatricopeptide repeat-containing protein At1g77360, mitochondrial-like [Diospyros lotus]XP_052196092.1 pentatricopeptide repeat-containing protein At1g77360, mitochondrial-like [Diospyros lotus]
MDRARKRSHGEGFSSSPSTVDRSNKKPLLGKRPIFASYLDIPDLHPKVKLLCDIVASTHSLSVEKVLEDTGVRVTPEDVEEVLKLSYGFPGPVVKFFRWAGFQLNDKHSPYSWNLVVDLLGKNCLFDAMWDAMKSMRKEGLISLATFASVFSSYAASNRVQEAIVTFEVMDDYGCPRDIVALNSLLSAICRHGETAKAREFLSIVKDQIRPDADSYAILLEGWESEGDAAGARQSFGEMVADIGWDPSNVPAYDSFLTTLLKGDGMSEALKFFASMKDRRCYPGMKFFKVALEECTRTADAKGALRLWESMVEMGGFRPDTEIYNSMVTLLCEVKDFDFANRLLDEMVCYGVFPDSQTYNILFHYLIKARKLQEASSIFSEMTKNELFPTHSDCRSAVRVFVDNGEAYMAIKVWKCMIENYNSDLEETGNLLVLSLRDNNKVPEAVKYADGMIDRGIKLNSSTLSKLKQSLNKARKGYVYDELLRKWKTR